jgi:hypothetical protein
MLSKSEEKIQNDWPLLEIILSHCFAGPDKMNHTIFGKMNLKDWHLQNQKVPFFLFWGTSI